MISVVIRTRDEEKWLGKCLQALKYQGIPNLEVVVVDSGSTDQTLAIAKQYRCRLVEVEEDHFTYGRALNLGIQASRHEYVAILSAHCIPLNDQWAERLVINFTRGEIAACYGRQEPLPDSDIFDKRDLWTTFGLDRRTQVKDYFFHNANAMIQRRLWELFPFDETLSGVEDRAWAKQVIAHGYQIVYEPEASVYHYHGIHQGRDPKRCERVVKVIEWIHNGRRPVENSALKGNPQ